MRRSRLPLRSALTALSAAAVLFGLTACAGAPGSAGSAGTAPEGNAGSTVEVSEGTILLDVRTPEEFAAGHLDGAQLVDFNGGEIPGAILTLDPEAEYLVYCRSGNRSGQAIELMAAAGFTNLTNLGSLEQAASATGIAVVQ
ncbi:rhodanese-like domain-containing protein [Leucobacter sp. BZR 635]